MPTGNQPKHPRALIFFHAFQALYFGEWDPAHHRGFWNLLGGSWKASSRFQIDTQAQWTLADSAQGFFQWGDPRVGMGGLPWLSSQGFLYMNFNVEIPITASSRELGKKASPGIWQQFSYQFDESRLSLYAEHWVRWSRGEDRRLQVEGAFRKDLEGNFNPGLRYRTSPRLLVELRASVNYRHRQSLGFEVQHDHDWAIQPGLSWNPTASWNLRPFFSLALLETKGKERFLAGLSTTALF